MATSSVFDVRVEHGLVPFRCPLAIALAAGIVALMGIVVGVPLGLALGPWLWTLFAEEIGAVPAPAVPAPAVPRAVVVATCLIAVALAMCLRAPPGRLAARTPAAAALAPE